MAHVPGLPGWSKRFIQDCDAFTSGVLSPRDQQRIRSLFPSVVRVPIEGRDLDELVYIEMAESDDPRLYRVLVGYEDVHVRAIARRGPLRREVEVDVVDRIQVAIAPEWVRVSIKQNKDTGGATRIDGDIDADDLTERLEKSWYTDDVSPLRMALCVYFWAAEERFVPDGTAAATTLSELFLLASTTVLSGRQRKGATALLDAGWTGCAEDLWEAAMKAEEIIKAMAEAQAAEQELAAAGAVAAA